jgi:hypothetical protein
MIIFDAAATDPHNIIITGANNTIDEKRNSIHK